MTQAFAKRDEKVRKPYHYTQCGLDDVYLMNGYYEHETPYGNGVSIDAVDELHTVIAMQLCLKRAQLHPKEFRFLRRMMDLTQGELALLLGCDAQTVARWEKGQTEAPGTADRMLRLIYLSDKLGKVAVKKTVEQLATLDDRNAQKTMFEKKNGGWKEAA